MDFEALIAAGGLASRLGPLPCSKEIFPLSGHLTNNRIKVICENLLEYYRISGIRNIHFIIRKGKWDILQLLGDGSEQGVHISYHIMNLPYGTPFTLDQAYPFIKDKCIAMGFPDMVIEPKNTFSQLKDKLIEEDADIVLGIFPVKNYRKWDMIDFENDNIKEIVIKGDRADLKYGWSNVVWKPSFTQFMHEYLRDLIGKNEKGTHILPNGSERELYVGDVVTEAMNNGLKTSYIVFKDGYSIDIGTHEEMTAYLKQSTH